MKQFVVSSLLLLSAGAMAAPAAKPLLTQSNGSGFTPPEWTRYETCEIYKDRVVTTRQFGTNDDNGFKVVETQKVKLSAGVTKALERAAQETVEETENMLCDGPSTLVTAHGTAGDVTLYSTGGCGTPTQQRTGSASRMLREVVDVFCPKGATIEQ